MSDHPNLDHLTELVDSLHNLVHAPELGLFTWHQALAHALDEIVVFRTQSDAGHSDIRRGGPVARR